MKNSWDEIVKEKVSPELKHRTMARARQELEARKKSSYSFLIWLAPLVSGVFGWALWSQRGDQRHKKQNSIANGDMEVLSDLAELSMEDLDDEQAQWLAELEFYEDLDILEDWDGTEES